MENSQHLPSDLERQIEAAKGAKQYFTNMLEYNKAVTALIQANLDAASDVLKEMEEKNGSRQSN